MAARTPANTTIVAKANVSAPTVSTNVKTVQSEPILVNATGGCIVNKVLLQGQ